MSTHNLLCDNDIRFVDFAKGLSQDDREHPSLCSDWNNHGVLAHLVIGYMASPPTPSVPQ